MRAAILNLASLGVLAVAVSMACQKTEFKSPTGAAAVPSYKVPGGEGLPAMTPLPYNPSDKSKVCGNGHTATRIAFVIDNSGSHAATGAAQGSDPVRTAQSVRGKLEALTRRQEAVYAGVDRTAVADQESVKTEPEFYGSDVGIVYFPRGDGSMDDYNSYVPVTGPGSSGVAAFPDVMTNMRTVPLAHAFRNGVWDALSFTHNSKGATPYLTALKGAKFLLDSNRKEDDPRKDVVIFITDGIPTDTSPKAVREFAKTEFKDKGVVIIMVFVFTPGAKQDMTDTPAYVSLQSEFNGARKWGREDGYVDFAEYWQALLNVPREIADHYLEVRDSSILKDQIGTLLDTVQKCE